MAGAKIITNGKIVTGNGLVEGEIMITEGRISLIGEAIPRMNAIEVIDAKGQYILPGMIDTHVHMMSLAEQSGRGL